MIWVWLALTVAFVVVEISTVQLVSIWLAVSAGITSIIVAIFENIPLIWQITIFVVLSAVLLIASRPFVKKFLKNRANQETNLELVVGKKAIVTEEIDNIKGSGAVKINGLIWSARSADNSIIEKDKIVVFKSIDGNKAIVELKEG